MTFDFTEIAVLIIILFGLYGWLHGVRQVAITTGGIFFAMVIVSLIGTDLVQAINKTQFAFHPSVHSDLFLAIMFVFTVCVVQFGTSRAIAGPRGTLNRQQRTSGASLSLLNGFLLVANVVRYADPYLRSVENGPTGGWTWSLFLPHISHPNPGTITLSIQATHITITPNPLLRIYSTLPTALILLFAFLIFVFIGTVYGRVIRNRR